MTEKTETSEKKTLVKKEQKVVDKKPTQTKQAEKTSEVFNPWKVLLHPYLAEKSMNMIEMQNKLTFKVWIHSTQKAI